MNFTLLYVGEEAFSDFIYIWYQRIVVGPFTDTPFSIALPRWHDVRKFSYINTSKLGGQYLD